jgi:DNA helicase HerA-like ATPase
MTDAQDRVAAARKALEEAQAALTAAESEAAVREAASPTPSAVAAPPPLDAAAVAAIRAGYAFDAPALEMGALVNAEALPDVPIRIPIAMVNRHGLVAGATGTGKTKTLQVLAEQLSAAGVPVFAADIKGDLSGIASPGAPDERVTARARAIGQDWTPAASPTEYFTLGGLGSGIPIRATVQGFGPLLLAKVLGLNATQESSLGLVFHYAERQNLPLVDLADLRAVLFFLVSDEGKGRLAELGGLSKATAGVILRELVGFADDGADVFFGEPAIDVAQFLRITDGGAGLVSLLEVPSVIDKPALFSTFLMWLLRELYRVLPEVGDLPKPKLVFFFDEAHLLFADASKDFLAVVTQTVRLIRSKGVGIFFVTQTPKDVPGDVLAQLGSRIQHQLRAHTPDDARALKATVSTYPNSPYRLAEVLTTLATGEAIVTVMNEKGAPSPVAWTRLRAPRGSMSPTPPETVAATVAASPLLAAYGTPADPRSAHEILAERAAVPPTEVVAPTPRPRVDPTAREAERAAARRDREAEKAAERRAREEAKAEERIRKETVNAGVRIARVLVDKIFGSTRR